MTLQDDLRANRDVALAFATSLEQQLGDDSRLKVGEPRGSISEVLPEEDVRAVAVTFTNSDGRDGTIAMVALQPFAEALERAASDEILLTSGGHALESAARALATFASTDVDADSPREINPPELHTELRSDDDNIVVYPIIDGSKPVACLAIALGVAASGSAARPDVGDSPTAENRTDKSAPLVLADVEMGVTAELGRCRMSVRELLSLTPGAVIDLDRAAGAPVDVLVNGTLIARGEVVVIDEEFGIRISEILKNGSPR